jgi:hypothetical protein
MNPMLLVFLGLLAGEPSGGTDDAATDDAPKQWLTVDQAKRIVARMAEREPFLSSKEGRTDARSTNLFFVQRDYRTMKGNPIVGYWNDSRFLWKGRAVAWEGIDPVAKSCQMVTRQGWAAAFAYVAKKQRLVVDKNAPMRVRGACVDAVAVPNMQQPNPGVKLEIRVESPTGVLKWRYSLGKPTLETAVGASVDLALLFAQEINQPSNGP